MNVSQNVVCLNTIGLNTVFTLHRPSQQMNHVSQGLAAFNRLMYCGHKEYNAEVLIHKHVVLLTVLQVNLGCYPQNDHKL